MISCNKMEIAGMRKEGNGNCTFTDGEVRMLTRIVVRANGTAPKIPMVELSIKVSYDFQLK